MTDRAKITLMLAPALILIGGLFFGGLAVGFARSLHVIPALGLTQPNLSAYRAVLAAPDFASALGLSLYIALTSTLLSLILAIAAALLLRGTGPGRSLIRFLFQLNLTVPHLVGAIGILYLFGQSGLFARAAFHTGLITAPADFPALIFDPAAIGIIAQYVWKEVPFIALIILSQLQTVTEDYDALARSLGASPLQTFRHVTLPLILPAALAAAILVFAFAFGAYEIPALLGQSHPSALPVLAWRSFTDADLAARPQAMAMAMIIAALSTLLILTYAHLIRRAAR